MKYTFFADPGHGWLKVPIIELINLKLAHLITSFSFHRGSFVYLEEDCDLTTFELAKKEKNQQITYNERISEKSRIRTYDRFIFENCNYIELKYLKRQIVCLEKENVIFAPKSGLPDTDQLFLEDAAGFRYKRNIYDEIKFNTGEKNIFCFNKL